VFSELNVGWSFSLNKVHQLLPSLTGLATTTPSLISTLPPLCRETLGLYTPSSATALCIASR